MRIFLLLLPLLQPIQYPDLGLLFFFQSSLSSAVIVHLDPASSLRSSAHLIWGLPFSILNSQGIHCIVGNSNGCLYVLQCILQTATLIQLATFLLTSFTFIMLRIHLFLLRSLRLFWSIFISMTVWTFKILSMFAFIIVHVWDSWVNTGSMHWLKTLVIMNWGPMKLHISNWLTSAVYNDNNKLYLGFESSDCYTIWTYAYPYNESSC